MLKPGYGMIVNETMAMIIMVNVQSCFLSSIHQILAGIGITERKPPRVHRNHRMQDT